MEALLLRILRGPRPPVLLRYGLSLAIVATAALVRYGLRGPLQSDPFLLFFPAVFLCALLFDRGSGLFATIFSAAVADYLFIDPVFRFDISWNLIAPLGIFILFGFTIAVTTEILRQTVNKLAATEQSKSILLDELGHRTRNDLAMVNSSLLLQARATHDPAVQSALKAASARIRVIAAAHDLLRDHGPGEEVDLPCYLTDLCGGLCELLQDVRPVAVRVRSDSIALDRSHAVAAGLIVNELVTNAFKYAFPGARSGVVDVEVSRLGSTGLRIVVRDNGIGCPADSPAGLGTRLVQLLAQQHHGTVERQAADPGCRVIVTLELWDND